MRQQGPHHDSSELYNKIDDILDESSGKISAASKRKLDALLGKLPSKEEAKEKALHIPKMGDTLKEEPKKGGTVSITIPDFKMPGFIQTGINFIAGLFYKMDNAIFSRRASRTNNNTYHGRQRPHGRHWS
jgi:hypothetical protein